MLGAIIGDIVGSRFEFVEDDNRGKDFAFFTGSCRFTDDTVCTLAVAKALLDCKGDYIDLQQRVIDNVTLLIETNQYVQCTSKTVS